MRTAAQPPNPIALLDSAFDLLRAAPPSAWLAWAAGSLPFGIGAIGFVSEMTSSANAAELLAPHALVLARPVSVDGGKPGVVRAPVAAAGGRERVHSAGSDRAGGNRQHGASHAASFAALSVIGFPWTAAFYYSATACPASSEEGDAAGIFRYASRQASTWSFSAVIEQTIALLLGLVVFRECAGNAGRRPHPLPNIHRRRNRLHHQHQRHVQQHLFAAAVVITWLLMDPLLRAVFVIRCFRVDAIRTGVDLRATLARFAPVAVVLALFIVPMHGASLSVEPQKLDRSIHEVTHRPEFLWQEPRQVETAPPSNAFIRFTQDAVRFISDVVHRTFDWLGGLVRAIMRWLMGNQPDDSPDGKGGRDVPFAAPALYVLLAVTVGIVIALLMRLRIQRRRKLQAASTTAGAAETLDLSSEEVSADQAPEDAWLSMAARLAEAGDLRLATRALYLAVLAGLGDSGLITINRARSNLDYQRELARRARGNTGLLNTFRGLVAVFERTWYGEHAMSRDAFDRFQTDALETRSRGPA